MIGSFVHLLMLCLGTELGKEHFAPKGPMMIFFMSHFAHENDNNKQQLQ
jgi:hypothetical protein